MSYAVEQDATEDRYYTQVDAGDVRLFTLDQLDAAFNAGLIHENTYVCLEGGSEWLTLGDVAGLGNDEASEPEAVSVVAPLPQRAPAQPAAYAAPYSVAPAAAAQSVPPLAPYSLAPVVASSSFTPSTRPVVSDLSLDDLDSDMMSMRPKRRAGKIAAGVAVVALGALGFAVVQSGGLRMPKGGLDKDVSQASAASLSLVGANEGASLSTPKAELAKVEEPKAELAKVEEPKAAEASDDAEPKAEKKGDDRFSDEMKAALLNKDKQQAVTQKTKKTAQKTASARKTSSSTKPATAFKSGGSAYDPLNGKL
jgi:hypothetical protein